MYENLFTEETKAGHSCALTLFIFILILFSILYFVGEVF